MTSRLDMLYSPAKFHIINMCTDTAVFCSIVQIRLRHILFYSIRNTKFSFLKFFKQLDKMSL